MDVKKWVWDKVKESDKYTVFSALYTVFALTILTILNFAQASWEASIMGNADYWKSIAPFILFNFSLPLSFAYSTREKKRKRGNLKDAIGKNHDLYSVANMDYWDEFKTGVNRENLLERTRTYLDYTRRKFETTKTYKPKTGKFLFFFTRKEKENVKDKEYWQTEKSRAYTVKKMLETDKSIEEIRKYFEDREDDKNWDIEDVKCPRYEVLVEEDYYASDSGKHRGKKKFNFGARIAKELATSRLISTLLIAMWTALSIDSWISIEETGLDVGLQFVLLFYGCYKTIQLVDDVMELEYLPYLVSQNGFIRNVLTKAGWKGNDGDKDEDGKQPE